MADRVVPLDVYVDGDLDTTLGSTEALRIRAIGTDKDGSITPSVNGNDLGAIRTQIGDIHTLATSEQGPLMLEDLYYYVPPDADLALDGASSDVVRFVGDYIDGVDGRFEMGADEARFNDQGSHHWTFTQGQLADSGNFADGEVQTVHTLTPNTDERYQFTGLQMMSRANQSTSEAEDQFNVLYEIDGQQIPAQFGDDTLAGVDIESMPRPPADTDETVGFTWDMFDTQPDMLVLDGDQTLNVNVRNVSGGTITAAGSGIDFTYTATVRFQEGL